MKDAKIFIAGCGGLGSNLALMLGRIGFRRFVLADCDRVDQSNLNRQHFFPCDLGKEKAPVLADYLRQLNSRIEAKTIVHKLSQENFAQFIDDDCNAVCECFDNPAAKAALTRFMLHERPKTLFTAVSGVGGIHAESLRIRQQNPNFFLITDDGLEGDVRDSGVFAPKVIAAAAFQASVILRELGK